MFNRERQVVMTYLTWKWMWFVLPLIVFFMVLSVIMGITSSNEAKVGLAIIRLGMPSLLGLIWLVAMAKWQFVNPRARLLPGYRAPHLTVLILFLFVIAVLNPLLLSIASSVTLLGPLAYTMVFCALYAWGIHWNSGFWSSVPCMIVFFSGMVPAGVTFWFSSSADYHTIHAGLIAMSTVLLIAYFWRLANLHEEQDDYQILPMGAPGSLSRLERDQQRKFLGRQASRRSLGTKLADKWHEQLAKLPNNLPDHKQLAHYGWGQFPAGLRAIFFGFGCAAYGVFLYRLTILFSTSGTSGPGLVAFAAIALPAVTAGFALRKRRARLAQELLRPESRKEFFGNLLRALAKQTVMLWATLSCALFVTVVVCKTPKIENLAEVTIGYLLWSLCLQLPTFALHVTIARWRSAVAYFLGMYAVCLVAFGLLAAWWHMSIEYGALWPTLLLSISMLSVGLPLYCSARRSWLNAELG